MIGTLRTLALLLLASATAASAQVVDTPEGTVEFIGLERWTVQMVRDTMAVRAPGEPLGRCAAVLMQLGFVSASSARIGELDGKPHTVVTVVEPQRRSRIRERVPSGDSVPDRAEWAAGHELFRKRNGAFQSAIQFRGLALAGDTAATGQLLAVQGDRAAGLREVWSFLDAHRSPADLDLAVRTLAEDRNWRNRVLAAAILTGFPEEPRAWYALLDAMRDEFGAVAGTSSQAAAGLLTAGGRTVDWRPVQPAIRNLLDGTNVFILDGALTLLTGTAISPELAAPLLGDGGGDMVLAHLGARHPRTRERAHAFLVQLAGRDLGPDRNAWASWIRSLEQHKP